MTEHPPSEFCSPPEAADFTGLSAATLEVHRARGTGPRFYRVGRLVKYTYSDLREWLTSNPVEPTPRPDEAVIPPSPGKQPHHP